MNVCTYCGREGHFAANCTWPKKANVKLHPEQVVRIRERCEERETLEAMLKKLTDKALAEEYGVSYQTIRDIRLGYAWVDV